ncbi:MAG TPA: S8 family serine peptidase, partial [Actinocrinis sp.]
ITVIVRDDAARPIEYALVQLLCPGAAATALTGRDGQASLAVPKELVETALLLEARPHGGHYDGSVIRPRLSEREPNVVACRRLTGALPDFPEQAYAGWAERALGLDRMPPTFRGHGVRVGLIDSGAHDGHPDLADRLDNGHNVLDRDDKSWREDALGNGTACAALIAGRDDQTGIVGLAPEAELHCLKAMPGGYSSDLIEALDHAMADRWNVVQLSVNCAVPSRLVAQKIEQARQASVACIAAAGNGTGPVPFPANLPNVLTVAAVGLHGTFPPESRAALEAADAPVSPEGLFVPAFSNAGPEINVCAPGVAIISAAPHGSYAALDGTAIAAAHVTAAAALVLAHHPQFRDSRSLLGAERVDHLFALIKSSARRPMFGPFGGPMSGA